MTEKCPTSGYACVNTLVARVMAVADQARGTKIAIEMGVGQATVEQMLYHYERMAQLIDSAVFDYVDVHGTPTFTDDLESIQWLCKELGL